MMGSYKLLVKKSAEKELRAIPKPFLSKISAKIKMLSLQPRPHGCEALSNNDKHYRLRQNDYRIVYTVDDFKNEVIIVKIGHRSDVYK